MTTLKPGEVFDKQYELIRLIDSGGFADVWEAKHIVAKGHTVALKIYPMLDVEGVKNIEEEYDIQKDLSHSNLLTVRHFGKDEEGHPYLVMRYCSGGNAARDIGNYTELKIAKVMQNVGAALAYLHQEDLVHQDMKPNNILIDQRDGQEYIFLADLGLSLKLRATIRKFTENKKSNTSSINTGMTPPPYRAPELWGKDNVNKPPAKLTDIWAFGATLFELITGDVPFGEFGGVNQMNDPNPPNLPADFKCSDDLNEIIKRCLSKDAWDRPSAAELAQCATNFIETGKWDITYRKPNVIDEPSIPDPLSPSLSPQSPPRWKEWAKWVAIVGIGALGALGVDYFWFTPKPILPVRPVVIDTTKPITPPVQPLANTDSIGKKKEKEVVTPLPPKIRVDSPPKNANIRITSIKRTPNALAVTFLMVRDKETTDNSTYAIYGTESPQYAFYVRDAAKNIYRLKSLIGGTNGASVAWGDRRSHTFTATFEPVPSYIKKVDIREAIERTPGESYWSFGGVHLP